MFWNMMLTFYMVTLFIDVSAPRIKHLRGNRCELIDTLTYENFLQGPRNDLLMTIKSLPKQLD